MAAAEPPRPRGPAIRPTSAFPVLLALLVAACAPPPRSAPPADPTPVEQEIPPRVPEAGREGSAVPTWMEEGDFPPPEDIPLEEDFLEDPAEVGATPIEPVAPTVETPVPQTPATGVRGFRVQLLALASRAEADDRAREARQRLGVEVHIEYEPPLFKLRAGDLVDRAAALRLRDRARELGYVDAWVVTTTVQR